VSTFRALLSTDEGGQINTKMQQVSREQLPPGDVLVRVWYSSLNYKDGLAVTGRPGVIRKFPMVPGIDFAGTVEESASPDLRPGDPVVLTGAGAGETIWGGYSQWARWSSEFLVPLPKGMTLLQSMAIGTAGFTAMQCVDALERHGLKPGGRDVLVTGAGGGVGSVAIAILGKLGYRVVASTGRPELGEYLRGLGAAEIVDRASLTVVSKRGLERERWDGAVDSVAGSTLAGILPWMANNASVAVCGMAGGGEVAAAVWPLILRGVNILGINSVRVAREERLRIWSRLSSDLPVGLLDSLTQVAPLGKISELGAEILKGAIRGRVVIDVNA
jgi:acrylyl-CoA reductase (NADPH)